MSTSMSSDAGTDTIDPAATANSKKRKISTHSNCNRQKRRKPLLPVTPVPHSVSPPGISPRVAKYWRNRYSLFSRYDEGIVMDEEGWFSVTPEIIAVEHARRTCRRGKVVVVDCFAGVGGNAIQFAMMCNHVVAIEIDPVKVDLARNNARIYGVQDKIDFVVGDFFKLAPFLKADILFLAPPWGGPEYKTVGTFTLDSLKPKDGYKLFQLAQRITTNIIMFLPRNVDLNQVEELSWLSSPPLDLEIQENYVDIYLKGITAYFGDHASR